jgi:hypothetical protein
MGGHRPMYVSTYDWPGTGKFGDQAYALLSRFVSIARSVSFLSSHLVLSVSLYLPNSAFVVSRFGEVMKESLEKLLYDYDVDLALWGHGKLASVF